MSSRYKGAMKDHQLEAYFPVRLSIVIGAGLPQREWSIKYSLMVSWLAALGADRHAVLPSTAPGRPDAMRVLLASFDDARAFIERFELPVTPIGEHPRR
jgi:hypothetical protein